MMSSEGVIARYLKKACVVVVVFGVFIQVRLYQAGVQPRAVSLMGGKAELLTLGEDRRLSGIVEKIGENDLIGPESLVASKYNGKDFIFAALGDGRIVRIDASDPHNLSWSTLIQTGKHLTDRHLCGKGGPTDDTDTELTCGRPLGMALVQRSTVDPNNNVKEEDVLIVLDVSELIMIDNIYTASTKANKHVLATHAKGDSQPFHLLNAVVQAPDNSLYFTETSTHFHRRRIFYAAFDGRPTGRLLRYTKQDGLVQVLKQNLYMPNGITLSHDQKSLIIVSGLQLLNYHIDTQQLTLFVPIMPGSGDNIKTSTHLPTGQKQDCYWAGLGSKCAKPFCFLQSVLDKPYLRALLISIFSYKTIVDAIPKFSGFAVYDATDGKLIETYQDPNIVAPWLAEAQPVGEYIYLASWYNAFLGRVKKQDLIAASDN